jgi:ankyrin repeat protein
MKTALLWAAKNDQNSITQYLIEAGADVKVSNKEQNVIFQHLVLHQ